MKAGKTTATNTAPPTRTALDPAGLDDDRPSASGSSIRGRARTRQAEEAESRPAPAGLAGAPPLGGEEGKMEGEGGLTARYCHAS